MSEWSIAGPVILGVVIAFIEMIFVHQDEAGMGWLKHGLHAIPVMFIFLFISMNVEWVIGFIPNFEPSTWMTIGVRVLIGLVAAVKIKLAAAVVGKAGEKTIHVIIIGALIAIAPYLWELVVVKLIGDLLPIQ